MTLAMFVESYYTVLFKNFVKKPYNASSCKFAVVFAESIVYHV